jgi:hypothetical protein
MEALFCLGNNSKGAKIRREFTSINPFVAIADLEEVPVIPEFPAAHCVVNLLCHPVRLATGFIHCITGVDGQESTAIIVHQQNNFLDRHRREENQSREDILEKNTLATQRNNSSATTHNRKVRVVPHPDLKVCDCLVRDKS